VKTSRGWRVAGVEQQQGRLAAGGGEIETDGAGAVASADFEPACRAMVETISGWSSM